ncbi:MAG: DNA polymerase III subunit alpha [Flavobacteriales bacterium]|nr:DNA polymerase III subunit alpha [Flavobacteriales bacterium]MCB9166419.1 DNA polymerase III subunit alpha [Flavobacteriales bacterium]
MLLNVHSFFSFKYGVLSPERLLKEVQAGGHRHVALTDINCSAGHSEFFRQAKDHDVHPVAGIDLRSGMRQLYVGLARNNAGLHQLNGLLTDHLLDGEALPERAPELPDTFLIHPYGARHIPSVLRENELIGVRPGEVDRMRFARLTHPKEKYVALTPATFRHKADRNTHRLLRAIDRNTLHTKLTPADLAPPDERFLSTAELLRAYAHAPELLKRTEALLEQCEVDLAFNTSKNLRTWSGDAEEDRRLLHELAQQGVRYRYGDPSPEVLRRLEHELRTIEGKDFVSYFLINWDLVRFAKQQGFFHVGRGSGANSLVAYCLGITDVDPIELDLYFERFINPARDKPPDFDIDFSWKDRDRITQRLFEKYGEGRRVALLATYSTFQERAIVQELGKVFGLPPHEIAALSAGDPSRPRWIGKGDRLEFSGRTSAPPESDPIVQAIHRYAPRLKGLPGHLSIHVGGVLISERPITHYTALHLPPKGFPTTQFSMVEAEDIGLYKFDILSQRGLGHIRDAVELVEQRTGERIDIHDVKRFKQDPVIKDMLRTGDTIGCFYVESPAMRMLMKKMRVDDYKGLVAASSIIRPGVSHSGMMREYLLRYHDPERRKLAPKKLLDIMPDTFGVMVYQEDVIKVGYAYAGLSLAEADVLRRSMSGKFGNRKEFGEVRESFFTGALAKGHPLEEVQELWTQIVSFGDFSFAKGHSASYAVESYQSLYLKAHHPLEFLVGVANNFGGFYHTEFYLHEAKRAGAVIEAPCVNRSGELCTLGEVVSAERGVMSGMRQRHSTIASHHPPLLFLGLNNIKGFPTEVTQLLLKERDRHGPFTDLPDLLRRVPLHVEQARMLVRVGALRFTGRSKPRLLWDLTLLHEGPRSADPIGDLFVTKVEEPRLPELHHHSLADAYDELELLGFPLCDPFTLVECRSDDQTIGRSENGNAPSHPFTLSSSSLPHILSRQMPSHINKRVQMLGYMIHVKATHTHTGQDMTFGSFIDTAGDFWDSTQFPAIAERHPFRGRGIYRLTGVVEEEFGHCALRTQAMEKLPWKPDPRLAG